MKKTFIFVFLFVVSFSSSFAVESAAPKGLTSGTVAEVSCKFDKNWVGFDTEGKVTFRIDLKTNTATDASDSYNVWHVRSHTQKAYWGIHTPALDLTKFEFNLDQPIRTLVLDGDNADDTDYLLTISYQSNCEDSKCENDDKGIAYATYTLFGDSDVTEAKTLHSKCTMKVVE